MRLGNETSFSDNGLFIYRGRAEVCVNRTFLPICDLGFDRRDAQVVCNQRYGRNYGMKLYYHNVIALTSDPMSTAVGEVYPSLPLFPNEMYAAQEPMCNGTEYTVTECGYNPPTSPLCYEGNRSAVVTCREGNVFPTAPSPHLNPSYSLSLTYVSSMF